MRAITARFSFLASNLAGLLLSLVAFSSSAHAYNDPHGWVGGNLGLSVPSYKETNPRAIWGINAGAKLGSEFGIGAYYLTSSKDETMNGLATTFGYDLYGVEFAYHFEGEARGAYIGGRLGMSQVKMKVGSTQLSTNPMHYGVVGGYNYFLTDHFSLGGELNYMSLASSSTTSGGLTFNQDSFSTLNFLASAKLWF